MKTFEIKKSGNYYMIICSDRYFTVNNETNMDDDKFLKLLQRSKDLSVKERYIYFDQLEQVVEQMSKREDRKKKLEKIWNVYR